MTQKIFNKKGFTLIELLVVVLIIGILAAIAVPQYQKAILKANLHKGVSLVESIYQAEQAYYLQHGDFTTDIDALDISVPKDASCKKTQTTKLSYYNCSFGRIGLLDSFSNIQFQDENKQIVYSHYLTDYNGSDLERKAGEVWCVAAIANKQAQDICEQLGGEYKGTTSASWLRYKIR